MSMPQNKFSLFLKIMLVFPILWLTIFAFILISGSISLGHIPTYGDHHDPYSLGLDGAGIALLLTTIITFISLISVCFVTIVIAFINFRLVKSAKYYILIYFMLLAVEEIIRIGFKGQYMWVFD